ncbi:hypothetical protein F4779DRAFT_571426 [Xylariaceae sp. FL0662B]|nr:hypothetical protein F4779DRAFT_571426 [Xylariaceae sp. FL0662B]
MDQDSRSSESRERAISSEPCSTRPNPFDDGDLSARKRRRTSLSGSRSASIDTIPSQEGTTIPSDSNVMKVDTPEPVPPSTPPRPEPAVEPVSSKVTINLRNADSLEATPASPTSPTPARFQKDDIKISVEESEVNMTPAPLAEEMSSSPSELDSPEAPNVSFEDIDDDLAFSGAEPNISLLGDGRAAQFSAAMLDFPYHGDGESYYDTVSRLMNYFRQQPSHVDEVLHHMHAWLERYLTYADPGLYPLVIETYQENRPFWQALPDLFYTIAHRHIYSKIRETRDLISQLFTQVARLTGFLLAIDYRTLVHASRTDDSDFDLISPGFLRLFGNVTIRDENQLSNGYTHANSSLYSEPLDVFQASYGGSLDQLNRFAELLTSKLLRFPKKVMESLVGSSQLADSLLRDSYQKQLSSTSYSSPLIDRSRNNLVLGLKYFQIVSNALDVVIDKSTNNLSSDTASCLVSCLTNVLRYSLHGNSADASKLIQDHRQQHPNVIERFTCDAIPFQWRLDVLCKMVRSRQMQLRVAAAAMLCDDLVFQWKSYQGRQEIVEDNPHLDYLRFLSGYLVSTGIVDYILGPTCHPEITQTSFNIVGFLAVTKTYTAAQTELFWQTLTSTQDPRISDALVRMMSKVIVLLDLESLSYMCEKFHDVSIDSFSACMRELFEQVTKQIQDKVLPYQLIPLAPYKICVRLLQESSVYGPQGSIAYPEIHQFTLTRFASLLQTGPDQPGRQTIWMACVQDIAAKSPTTSGSLQVISSLMGNTPGMQTLILEHDFTRLLVDELESTIEDAKAIGFTPVYAHPISGARRKIISNIIVNHGGTIDSDLGRRLWDLLVGNGAACQDDRKAAWEDLNLALKRTRLENPFLNACLQEYLPRLPPTCYCAGSLAFVREVIVPLVNDLNGVTLDDENSLKSAGLELLWQMILTAPSQTIEDAAILTLVSDIYVDSKSIMSYPLHRARRVHFALVQRCLQQLKDAARKLKTFSDGTASGDDEPMVIVATDNQHLEQELQFTRSLQVLTTLLKTLQTKPHFAAPDLRSLMLQTPSPVDGDVADLKYQAFDGDEQSEVKPLDIGLGNTAASLLASLREATGFDNYRLYYRGQPLAPSNTDICKSLKDLDIKSGLILVKRESGAGSSPVRIKPGASPLDIEILGHFKDLWDYLSMEEKLAREIYHFLISLPADDSVLAAFDDSSACYKDIFPLGQPFKSLYAIHALREYLGTRRLKSSVMQTSSQDVDGQQQTTDDQRDALVRAMSLIVAAICDPDVVEKCASEVMQIELSFQLVDGFVQLLKETMNVEAVEQLLTPNLSQRLSTILSIAAAAQTSQVSIDLINRSFEALLESCTKNEEFWMAFCNQARIQEVIQNLLFDTRPVVRRSIARLISVKSLHGQGPSGIRAIDFAELFWPTIFRLVARAATEPAKCEEMFQLSFELLTRLSEAKSSAIDLPICVRQWGELLLSHKTTEDIALPDKDLVAHGLITILHTGIREVYANQEQFQFPSNFLQKLFSRHLFPPDDERGPLVPQVILHTPSRSMLCDIIFTLAKDDVFQSIRLLQDLNSLTSYRISELGMEIYMYELPQLFERSNAIRAPCGYSGLRNLSNTCYLNSLFTQLFMNVGFRSFMLGIGVKNPETHQLLQETQILFAFLQDSRRRFVEPQACVSQIMTYDEAPIDIHNQMDVDEFYNLLFDRWEAQLPSEIEKKALRSIYGGELVQQVKSNECEHISERIEPFSAIQCDIKGKASLEESLQAYVDGEIMEGDNKYKCSDCDRHVDAVKRACLKDIPNNLIFHLKRFDFNLRTLQRSKINDYFPFPAKIDMQPYTIEHLSDPSHNSEPDMFELVGILVHSGTAESGHYYSFIRERPSADDSASWVEFNDEVVTPWDPSQMENACFGGPEYRSHFEAGNTYEKVFSAYMLFYQRSSSLQREQDMLKKLPGQSGPFRCRLPPDLELQVKEDNWATVQRHCLYDPTHIPFVMEVLANVWGAGCSADHKRENLAMSTALGHLDQVASRAKDLPDFDKLKNLIMKTCQRCSLCCFAFFEYFRRHREALRMLLQRNSDQGVRQEVGRALIFVLSSLKVAHPNQYGPLVMDEGDEPDLVEMTLDMFLYIWDTFHTRLNSWPEYFGTMVDFARLGRYETSMFLEKDFLIKLIMVITADPAFDLPPQYARLLNAVSRRLARPPNYEAIIALVDVLLSVVDPELDQERLNEHTQGRLLYGLPEDSIPLTVHEVNALHKDWARGQANIFVDKLIQLNQNPVATDSIISRLMGMSHALDQRIYVTLRLGITGELVAHMVSPYLRVAVTYCRSSVNRETVHRLIHYVSNQCKNLQNAEGRSFFEFQRDIYEGMRNTGETSEMIQLHTLANLPRWAPGLLGYIDHTVSDDVDNFLQEKLFRHGPSPVFGESNGGLERSQAMNSAARRLGIACLEYLRDTYVSRSQQAARDTVVPLDRVIKKCEPYFKLEEEIDDGLEAHYHELCQAVLGPMDRLTVDEIEEDGSDWEQSVGSSEQMEGLTDLSMQVYRDLHEGAL